jgi:tetratricopeptide (TPR) repeat protein
VRPHVVHLSGHGQVRGDGTGVFCFEDEEGKTDAVTAQRLVRDVFLGANVRCVFLNACQTSQAATACRQHAQAARDEAAFRWGSLKLAHFLRRLSEFGEARRVLQEVPEQQRDLRCLHELGWCEEALSNWRNARVLFERALAAPHDDTREDKIERSAVLHNLATIDFNEGNYSAARDKFQESLAIEQQVGNRAGEGATWAQLGNIDLRVGDYPAARDKLQKALAMVGGERAGPRAGPVPRPPADSCRAPAGALAESHQ